MTRTHLLAGLVVALAATPCLAEMPELSTGRPLGMPLLQPGRLLGGQGWWARYGEPVNANALAEADAMPADKMMPAGHMSGYGDGYVFGPGACDCPPPCIWQLWAGYWQNPKRCHPCHWLHRNAGCDPCGAGACGNGCGHGCGLFGHGGLFGGHGCGASVSCGCATPVTCSTAVNDCGCKPVCGKCRPCHLGSRFLAHWSCGSCSSCAAPLSCGCATPVAPAVVGPEKQALQGPPRPLPDEALLHPLPRLR